LTSIRQHTSLVPGRSLREKMGVVWSCPDLPNRKIDWDVEHWTQFIENKTTLEFVNSTPLFQRFSRLTKNKISDTAVTKLAEALIKEQNTSVNEIMCVDHLYSSLLLIGSPIRLFDNFIGDDGAMELAKALRMTSVTVIE
jgi:hypothetical protein